MQIMSGTSDSYFNALANISILPSESISSRNIDYTKEHRSTTFLKCEKKCRSKFYCLIYEILFIKDIKSTFNTQTDSIRTKLFT